MLDKILNLYDLGGEYKKLIDSARAKISCSAFGMGQIERIISSIAMGKVLYITSDYVSAKRVYDIYRELIGNRAKLLPSGADVILYKKSQSSENNANRISTLFSLSENALDVVVAPVDALFSYLPNVDKFRENILEINVGDEVDPYKFAENLVKIGYKRESLVSAPGQFSIRGDIFDVFPINSNVPYRIDFFDIHVDFIHIFSVGDQTSKQDVEGFTICPNTDLFLDKKDVDEIERRLDKIKNNSKLSPNELSRKTEIFDEVMFRLRSDDRSFSLDYIFPLIKNKLSSVLDYLDRDCVIVFDEVKMVYDSMAGVGKEIDNRIKTLEGTGEVLSESEIGYLSFDDIVNKFQNFTMVAHQKITNANRLFSPKAIYSFKSNPVMRYTHNLSEFAKDIESFIFNGYTVFIMAGNERGAKHIQRILLSKDIDLDIVKTSSFKQNKSCILPFEITSGFMIPNHKIIVIGTYDILPKKQLSKKVIVNRKEVFSVPKAGDYVVHEKHGIGICEGVTKLSGNFGTKDYVVVRYRDDDKLYVPIEQLDMLERFSGADVPKKLSKIGGAEFAQVKEKVKKKIREMAFDLLNLYAKREQKKGFIYPKDDMVQKEFENAFPYTETEDQLISISEIKKDMESGKVMDRLLCGDVGFGKTEVALRVAFKAILAGKQVAFIAPTTILSQQHYNTCKKRFDAFGVNVGLLNRFKTEAEKTKVIAGLASGDIDIVCGTHRVLSKDVVFKDLGLIILDEEQKFGVEDKEKIKLNNENVDVLTLSATPIPRTLHMSLSGIRDISVISTPPSERLPVQTSVTEYSDGLIKDAITREMSRGGQCYIIYNRVESIYAFKEKIQKIVPDANIVVGHGQLTSGELEDVMYKFYNNMADVLICTTIIENGVDLSNANTLIVIDSDKFGLSTLYQIRGRVGRGSRMAYAYFTYNPDKSLTEESYKRLDAISEFTEFGSGFKIAMRDLEIRGSGNVLGAEQHGHMQKVGYDMYCKLLNSAVEELRGNKVKEKNEVIMKIALDAFVPETYIEDSENRMTVYKNISAIDSEESKIKLEEDIKDMFGPLPMPVKNLTEIAYLKYLANLIDCTEVVINSNDVKLVFKNNESVMNSENVASAVYKYSTICVLNFGLKPTIVFKLNEKKNIDALQKVKEFLKEAVKNIKK